jgi:hypothetical protein
MRNAGKNFLEYLGFKIIGLDFGLGIQFFGSLYKVALLASSSGLKINGGALGSKFCSPNSGPK